MDAAVSTSRTGQQVAWRPSGPDYLSSLPAEVKLLIFENCFLDSVIDRNHDCWNVSRYGHSPHRHSSTADRNILLTSKVFYREGIELYYDRSLLHIYYCCMQTCFLEPEDSTSPGSTASASEAHPPRRKLHHASVSRDPVQVYVAFSASRIASD